MYLEKKMKASELKCCRCGEPAVALWPLIDPDIPPQPYCRKCLNEAKVKVLMETFGYDEKVAKEFTKAMEVIE